MFGNNVRACHYIPSFERAEGYFNKTPPFKGRAWTDATLRGLGNRRQTHYALHKINDDAYSVRLYATDVIIYDRPLPTGERTAYYYGTHHTATWRWLWHHASVGNCNQMTTTEGRQVMVPIADGHHTRITTLQGKLVESTSDHPVVYTLFSTAEDKAKRAAFKRVVEPVIDLAMLRCQWTGAKKEWYSRKKPFSGMVPLGTGDNNLHKSLSDMVRDEDMQLTDACVVSILAIVNAAYNFYNDEPAIDNFRKAFTAYLMRGAGLDKKHGRKEFPMFPDADSAPRSYFVA